MGNTDKSRKIKPIDIYIKEVYELAEKTEKMEIIKLPTVKKKRITKKNLHKK